MTFVQGMRGRTARTGRLAAAGLIVASAFGWVTAAPAVAGIARTTVSASTPRQTTDWSQTVTVPRFAPGPVTGDLLAVEVTLTGHVGGLVAFENVDAVPADVQAALRARIAVSGPDGELVAITPSAVRIDALPAFDGMQDDGGDSGRTWSDLEASATATVVLTDAASLNAFSGTGRIALGLDAVGDANVVTSTASISVDLQRIDAGADVDVTYVAGVDTTPPAAPTVSAPPSPRNTITPSWTFTAEPGSLTSCQLVGPAGELVPWSDCASPYVADLTGQDDGQFVLAVRATDAAGNTGDSASAIYELDRTPPAAPTLTSAPISPGSDATPTWTFSGEAGGAMECSVNGGTFAACADPFTADLTTADDGVHSFAVRATNVAGNTGDATSSAYTLDRTAPGAPAIGPPPSPASDPTPTWTVETETGSVTECAIDDGDYTACAGSFTADLTGAADGTHVLAARATDAAGNVGAEATSSYVLDRAAPDRPSITPPASPGTDRSPTWTIEVEADASTECSLDGEVWAPCTSAFTADLGAAADGSFTLLVRATDAAGNTGAAAANTYILDTVAPLPPAMTGQPADPSPDDTPTWTFSAEPGATTECSLDEGEWTTCTGSFTADLIGAADGRHQLAVQATDAAGNVSSAVVSPYVLDRAASAAPTITGAPTSPSSDATPTWTFTLAEGDTAECAVDGAPFSPCAGSFTPDLAGTADGGHQIAIKAVDAAGNRSQPAIGAFVLDRIAPSAPVLITGPSSPSNGRFPAWSFSAEDGATTACSLDGGPFQPCAVTFTVDLGAAADGRYDVAVHATDAAGNTGAAMTSSYVLDATGPAAPTFLSGPTGRSRDADVTWTFEAEPDATIECSLNDEEWIPCEESFSADLSTAADGAQALSLRATDPAGNTGSTAVAAFVLDRLPPLAPTFTGMPPSPSAHRSPAWTFTAEVGAAVECSFDGGEWLPCSNVYQALLTRAVNGAHTLAVRATDAAGNRGPAAVGSYVLDTTSPPPPEVVGPSSPGSAAMVIWTISTIPGTTIECAVDGQPFAACSSPVSTRFTGPDGAHVFSVRAIDDAGNPSDPTTVTYVLDTTPPAAPRIDGTPADNELAPSWRVSSEPGTILECSLDGGPWMACAGVLPVAAGTNSTIAVRAVDEAGNRSVAVAAVYAAETVADPAPSAAPPAPTTEAGLKKIVPDSDQPPTPLEAAIAEPGHPVATPKLEPTRPLETSLPAAAEPGRPVSTAKLEPTSPLETLLPGAVRAIQTAAEHGSIPVALILVVVVFLAVQDRIDRRDPKLSLAPLRDAPEYLEFTDADGAHS